MRSPCSPLMLPIESIPYLDSITVSCFAVSAMHRSNSPSLRVNNYGQFAIRDRKSWLVASWHLHHELSAFYFEEAVRQCELPSHWFSVIGRLFMTHQLYALPWDACWQGVTQTGSLSSQLRTLVPVARRHWDDFVLPQRR